MKMKNILIICVLLLCSGCLNPEVSDVFVKPVEAPEETKFIYTPGTYSGVAQGHGGLITVEVTVSDSEIKNITIVSQNESGYYLDELEPEEETGEGTETPIVEEGEGTQVIEENTTPEEEVERTYIDIEAIMDGLINKILQQQSADVELVTGATLTSTGLIEAITRALTEASLQ